MVTTLGSLSVRHTVAFAKLTSDGVWLPPLLPGPGSVPQLQSCLPSPLLPSFTTYLHPHNSPSC